MNYNQQSLLLHEKYKGKLEIRSLVPLESKYDLSVAYTPGVAQPCLEISNNKQDCYRYTRKCNSVAIVTDGTAVLGLGDIGPHAALPVMEGKAILFKQFGGIDAFPICLDTKDVSEIVAVCAAIAPTFGGINLEDIAAPRCFEIERQLIEKLDIPVFHDDQHGTAIVTLAGLLNALKLTDKKMDQIRAVICGAGSAGIAVAKLLMDENIGDIVLCDKTGAIYEGMPGLTHEKLAMSRVTNKNRLKGSLQDVIKGADVFIGVSAPGVLSQDMVASMNKPIVFAMANPVPEIMPHEAKATGALVVATGRSDFPNQINNLLAFPGIFRAALDLRAPRITTSMRRAAAYAIASLAEENLSPDYIIPSPLDPRVMPSIVEKIEMLFK